MRIYHTALLWKFMIELEGDLESKHIKKRERKCWPEKHRDLLAAQREESKARDEEGSLLSLFFCCFYWAGEINTFFLLFYFILSYTVCYRSCTYSDTTTTTKSFSPKQVG